MPMQGFVAYWVPTALMAGVSSYAMAQNTQFDSGAAARAGAIAQAQKMAKLFPDCRRLRAKDPSGHPPAGNKRRSGRGDCELSAKWFDDHRKKNPFSKVSETMTAPASLVMDRRTAGRSAHAMRKNGFLLTRTSRCSA